MSHDNSVRKTAVRVVQRTVSFDGARGAPVAVCPRRHMLMSVERCGACAHFAGLVITPSEGTAHLRCAFDKDAGASETPARDPQPVRLEGAVADVMTPIHRVATLETQLAEVEAYLLGNDAMPVMDEARRPIGVLTMRDVLARQIDRERANALANPSAREPRPLLVADVAMRPAFGVDPDTSIAHVGAIMAQEGIDHVLAIDAEGTLVGTISVHDIVRWVACCAGYLVPSDAQP